MTGRNFILSNKVLYIVIKSVKSDAMYSKNGKVKYTCKEFSGGKGIGWFKEFGCSSAKIKYKILTEDQAKDFYPECFL